eukprot:5840285-Prymnesium_polylepis.1
MASSQLVSLSNEKRVGDPPKNVWDTVACYAQLAPWYAPRWPARDQYTLTGQMVDEGFGVDQCPVCELQNARTRPPGSAHTCLLYTSPSPRDAHES